MNEAPGDDNHKRFQVDRYELRLGPDEPDPKSWQEVRAKTHQSLMSVALSLVSLPAELLKGVRKIIRGIADLPVALATRVSGAHKKVAKQEAAGLPKPIPPKRAEDDLRDALERLQEKGISVQIKDVGGRLFIALGANIDDETIKRIVDDSAGTPALPPPGPSTD